MKKVNGLYWDENPDWQHDKWQFQQLIRECRIFRKMVKDRQWVLDMGEDLLTICEELKERNDTDSALLDIELSRKMTYYQGIALDMYVCERGGADG